MKATKKILSLLLVLAVIAAFGATAFAVDTGSVTVTSAEPGQTYALFKLFDATVSGTNNTKIAYQMPAGKTNLVAGGIDGSQWFDVDAGNVTAKSTLNASQLSSAAFKTWAQAFGTQFGAPITAVAGTPVKFDNVPYGYYFVSSTLGAVISVDSVNMDVNIADKNAEPTFDKRMLDSQGRPVQNNSVGLGEIVPFVISGTTTNYVGGKKVIEYKVEDTLSAGWSYVVDGSHPLTVKVGGVEITQYNITPSNWSGTNAFSIVIPWVDGSLDFRYSAGATLEVTYFAKLDPAKMPNGPVSGTAYTNDGKITWTLDDGSTGYTPIGTTGSLHTETFVTEITVNKKDGANNNAVLTGAEFTLTGSSNLITYTYGTKFVADPAGAYWKLKDGSYTDYDPNTPGTNTDAYESLTQKYRMDTVSEYTGSGFSSAVVKGFVDSAGKVIFKGLGEGTYTLTESVVPAGYNKAPDVTFQIVFDQTTKTFSVVNPAGGTTPVTVSGNVLSVDIVNNVGSELPSTGGIGTTIFYVLGSCMLLGAAVLLITRKRMKSEG